MTERPLSPDEEDLIQTCYWVVNQHGMNDEVTSKHDAMLQFYIVACPVQTYALINSIAELDVGEFD